MTLFRNPFYLFFLAVLASINLIACSHVPTMTREQIERERQKASEEFYTLTTSKPYQGQDYISGKEGGEWNTAIMGDPKTFNFLIAERDGSSSGILNSTTDELFEYDYYSKSWKSKCASYEIETDMKKGMLTLHVTLRNDMFWTYIDSDEKIPVTSDDIVWWFNEISGDPEFQSSAYSGQFVAMSDGSVQKIKCVKIDDRHFDYIFPRIVADPVLVCNDNFKPSFIFKKAKEEGGVEGVKKIFGIDTDVKKIPSMGMYYIESYTPAQRIIFAKNENYWKKDSNGISLPYYKKRNARIIDNSNTAYLLFTQGHLETYSPDADNLEDIIRKQEKGYTVFNSRGSLSAGLWTFNQNPKNKDKPCYEWFTKKEFRQAMSCILNRDRIINQTYRGLASPKYDLFCEGNQYYNQNIQLQYKFDLEKARDLLHKAGLKENTDGLMCDKKGRTVEFDLAIISSDNSANDMVQIICDEAKKVGITINPRQTDFQKLVDMLTKTFDWQSLIIYLGANLFPSQGANVWPSSGNLHLWYPFQEKPATDWEKRIDFLYNEGVYTQNQEEAKKIWDEFQSIILEECPLIYLIRPAIFFAINNRWNLTNWYYDNLYGPQTTYIWLRQGGNSF